MKTLNLIKSYNKHRNISLFRFLLTIHKNWKNNFEEWEKNVNYLNFNMVFLFCTKISLKVVKQFLP
jgi:hypothetical protein